MGKSRYLRRKLQGLDLTRSECLKRGPSMHCYPSNDCDQGWQCVPAKDVNPTEWVGTYCYDPACITNRVDDGSSDVIPIPFPNFPPTNSTSTPAPSSPPADSPSPTPAPSSPPTNPPSTSNSKSRKSHGRKLGKRRAPELAQ